MHKGHFSAITVVVCGLTFVALSLAQSAPEMPKIEGESLAGHKVVLPDAAAGRVTYRPHLRIFQGFESPDQRMGEQASS